MSSILNWMMNKLYTAIITQSMKVLVMTAITKEEQRPNKLVLLQAK